jgi:hypothetical protein
MPSTSTSTILLPPEPEFVSEKDTGLSRYHRPPDPQVTFWNPESSGAHRPQGPSHRGQPAQKGAVPRRIGRTKGGLNSKLRPVCDGQGRPLILLLSEGQMSDYKGAALMLDALPQAKAMRDAVPFFAEK